VARIQGEGDGKNKDFADYSARLPCRNQSEPRTTKARSGALYRHVLRDFVASWFKIFCAGDEEMDG
jgi:hypothetical protein